jgi:hypothetical protein
MMMMMMMIIIIIIIIMIKCFRTYIATRFPEITQAVFGVGNSRLKSNWI